MSVKRIWYELDHDSYWNSCQICLTCSVEAMLDAADRQAASTTMRYSHDEVFGSLREELHRAEAVL